MHRAFVKTRGVCFGHVPASRATWQLGQGSLHNPPKGLAPLSTTAPAPAQSWLPPARLCTASPLLSPLLLSHKARHFPLMLDVCLRTAAGPGGDASGEHHRPAEEHISCLHLEHQHCLDSEQQAPSTRLLPWHRTSLQPPNYIVWLISSCCTQC